MPRYKFVAVALKGGDKKDSKVTRSIRSHAIRAGLQKRSKHSEVEKVAPEISAENPKQSSKYRIESLCSGAIDPFNSLPIPTNPEVDCLLKHLLIKFDSQLSLVERGYAWLPYALQSAPMMHSTLAMTAVMWRAECLALEASIQIEGIQQKGEALRQIRAQLEHPSRVLSGDEKSFLMSAMSTLVLVEVWDSNFEAAEMHLHGVHGLFNSRGGRDSLENKFIPRKSIILADIQVAAALGRPLMFPVLHTDQPKFPASALEQDVHLPFDNSVINDRSYNHIQIFAQIRQLLLARRSPKISLTSLRDLFNALDASILQHLYQDCLDVSDASRRSRALVLAAQVFVYVTLRQVPPGTPLVCRICSRLQNTIGLALPERAIWTNDKAALLWISYIGLLGIGRADETETFSERLWFLGLFQSSLLEFPQESPLVHDSIYRAMYTFLWDEAYCQAVLADALNDFRVDLGKSF